MFDSTVDRPIYRAVLFYLLITVNSLVWANADTANENSSTDNNAQVTSQHKNTIVDTKTHATGTTTYTATTTPTTEFILPNSAKDNYDTLNNFLNKIETQEAINGAYDENLAEVFFGLGKTLQRLNRHEDAIDAFKHAMHVNRVNHGLHSVTQAPMMQGIIKSKKELGAIEEISDHYYQLLWTYGKHYGSDSAELLPILDEASNWHRSIYLMNKTPDYLSHLLNSLSLTDSAVEISSRQYGSDSTKVIKPLKKLVLDSYFLSQYYSVYQKGDMYDKGEQPIRYSSLATITNAYGKKANNFTHDDRYDFLSFKSGRDAYLKLIDILQKNNAPVAEQAQAMTALGDWMLIFGKSSAADQSYRMAWNLLTDKGNTLARDALFGAPKRIPDITYLTADYLQATDQHVNNQFQPNALTGITSDTANPVIDLDENLEADKSASQSNEHQRFVRVSLSVGKRGRASNFSILDTQPVGDNDLIRQARKLCREFQFRARYESGQGVVTSGHQLVLNFN
jgi:tetratricopeptide (TPR) repeat protein